MPQIDQIGTIYFSQLFWLLVVFGLIYLVIGRWMLPRIEGTIHARNDRVEADLAAAESARVEAEQIDADYQREMDAAHVSALADLQAATRSAASHAEAEARRNHDEIDARMKDAALALATARANALGEVEAVAATAAREIVQRVAGLDVDDGAAAAAVRELAA